MPRSSLLHYPLNVQIILPFDIIIRHYLCSNRGVKVQFFQFFPPNGNWARPT